MIELYQDQTQCCGCGSCSDICPKNAITMTRSNGFDYPSINSELCIECGLCKKICSFQKEKNTQSNCIAAYAYKNSDDVRMLSSSGGIFTALTDHILSKGGFIYGACFDQSMTLRHIRATDIATRDRLRGSKYIQSNTQGIYKQVKQDLKDGHNVLFTGTPCQVSALRSYLGAEYENLFCIDLICHGVPSPEVWERFVQYLEEKYNGKLINYSFRNKQVAWRRYSPTATFADGRVITENDHLGAFIELFRYDVCLRPSCTQCRYSSLNRVGDITIGDFWGIENALPKLDDNKGVSCIMVNTTKGEELLKSISTTDSLTPCTQEQISARQPNLFKSSNFSIIYESFQTSYDTLPFSSVLQKFTRVGIKRRIKDMIKKLLHRS